jgi:hypothetical protein
MKLAAPIALILFALLFSSRTLAGDAAAAQALFDEATGLMSHNRFAEACAKFEESQRQDPGIGTLYHFADCEDRLGKTATAWAAFREVAAEARALGETARALAADARVSAMKSRLPRLLIDPGAETGTFGLELYRDGRRIGAEEWGLAIPVDPGVHVVEARAPGKGTWTATASVADGAKAVVTVPLLASVGAAPPPVAEAPPAPPSAVTTTTSAEMPISHPGRGQRVAGIIIGAAGFVGLGVGGSLGIVSIVDHRSSDSNCTGNVCNATGVAQRNDAQQAGTIATIGLSAGGVLLLAGIITYATAPSGYRAPVTPAQAGFRPHVAIGPGSVMLEGTW